MKTLPNENNNTIKQWSRIIKRKLSYYLPYKIKVYLILVLTFLLSLYIFYSITHYVFLKNHFDPIIGTEGKTCPACFGSRACPSFFRGEINIKGLYRLPILQSHNTRQIFESYHGFYNRKTEVVLKKLATRYEHENTDLRICNVNRYRNVEGKCYPKHALWYYLDYHPSKEMQLAHLAQTRDTAPMTHCITERFFDRIKRKYRERDSPNIELPLSRREEILLLYTLNLNQQPLVLQLFPAEDGWPFPRYIGACGRWVVEEHAGHSLDRFCQGKIWQKITILMNLLKLPMQLDSTREKSDDWTLYIGDPDPENFMVNPISLAVKIVDLEHMLLVDVKHLREIRIEKSNEMFQVKPDPCGVGLSPNYFNCTESINKETLCSRESSDHNLHSICAMLLSYHDPVKAPVCLINDNRLKNVRDLLQKCVYDEKSRLETQKLILTELEDLLNSIGKEDL